MKCPACSSERVYHSRAKTLRDQTIKRILPITFYRCHECGWRRPKLKKMNGKQIALHLLALAGYIGSVGLALAVVAGFLFVTLTFLGVPMPW